MFENTFKALSDPQRRAILELLKNGEKMTAGDIALKFDVTQATISYHLSLLKKADLIREEKYKNYIYYELNTSVFDEIIIWFKSLGGGQDEKE